MIGRINAPLVQSPDTAARARSPILGSWTCLILTSRTLESVKPFQAEIEELGRRAVGVELDVRDKYSIEAMSAEAEKSFRQA